MLETNCYQLQIDISFQSDPITVQFIVYKRTSLFWKKNMTWRALNCFEVLWIWLENHKWLLLEPSTIWMWICKAFISRTINSLNQESGRKHIVAKLELVWKAMSRVIRKRSAGEQQFQTVQDFTNAKKRLLCLAVSGELNNFVFCNEKP